MNSFMSSPHDAAGGLRDLEAIVASGRLKVGTTGDYRPFSDKSNGIEEGFDIAVAERFASRLGLKLELVATTWPTLMQDLRAGKYDIGMSGITRTADRRKEARFSKGYLISGKTILVAARNAQRFTSIADIDDKDVRIGVNPGGTNEAFVKAAIQHAQIEMFSSNLAIPQAVVADRVDVMITDSVEASYYAGTCDELAAPLAARPFTCCKLSYMMPGHAKHLQATVDGMMDALNMTGEMEALKKKYLHISW